MSFLFKKLIQISLVILLFCLLPLRAFAADPIVSKILAKYTSSINVEVDLKKTDEKAALGTKATSSGLMKFAKGKIFVQLESDKKVEFLYNKNTVWLIEYADPEFDKNGPRKVTILKKSLPILMKSLVSLFSDQKTFFSEFKVISEKNEGDNIIVDLKPREKNLKSFSLVLNKKEKTINQVYFVDDVDTKTILDLDKLKLNRKIDQKIFTFQKLKTDEVTTE